MLSIRRDGILCLDGREPVPLDPGNPLALVPHLGASVEFAPDLDGGALMRCLSPWAAFLSLCVGSDVAAWTKFAGGSMARSVPPRAAEPLSHLLVRPVLAIHPWDARPTACVEWRTTCVGSDGTYYAVPADPFSWSRLPVRASDEATVEDRRTGDHPTTGPFRVEPTLYDALILGFLDEVAFHLDPETAIREEEETLSLLDSIRADIDA